MLGKLFIKCAERGLTDPFKGGNVKLKSFMDSLKHACKVPNTDQPYACVDMMVAGVILDKVLGLQPKSWFYHSGTVPFLQEVREAILKAQSDKDYLTKRSAIVLQLRGKVFKVQNDLRSVRLVFEKSRA